MRRLSHTNTWIALTVEQHAQHAVARGWYDAEPLTPGDLTFCAGTETSFLRLITQARVMNGCGLVPLTNAQAVDYLDNVYRDPVVSRAAELPATRALWLKLARVPLASPHVWMDAYLAAFAIALGAEFVTFDRAINVTPPTASRYEFSVKPETGGPPVAFYAIRAVPPCPAPVGVA